MLFEITLEKSYVFSKEFPSLEIEEAAVDWKRMCLKGYIISDQQKSKFSNGSKLGKAVIKN